MTLPNIHDLFVFILKREVTSLYLKYLDPLLNDLQRLMVENLQRINIGMISKNAKAVHKVAFWLQLFYPNPFQWENLARLTAFPRSIGKQSLIFYYIEAILYHFWDTSNLLQVAWLNFIRINVTIKAPLSPQLRPKRFPEVGAHEWKLFDPKLKVINL